MRYADLVDILQTRSQRLGLVGPEGMADAVELELYLWQALLDVVEMVDIPQYLHYSQAMHVTQDATQAYALPEDFGRLILPRVQNKRGIYLYDGVTSSDLEYLDPNAFTRLTSYANARPVQFTVLGRTLWLYPPPDDNGASHYVLRGLYVLRVDRPSLDETVVLAYPAVLVDQALYRLATDMKMDVPALVQSRNEGLARLTQGSR